MKNIDIPNDFFSDVEEEPFSECKVCGCDLSDGQTPYSIEKAYKRVAEGNDVTLFEMVICLPCAEEQSLKMSKSSREFMDNLMAASELMMKRTERWETNWRKDWKSNCWASNKKIEVNEEYHMVGQFKGGKVMSYLTPFVLGQDFINEMQENLSAETKDEMNRFGEQFLGPDPTLKALMNDHQFVLV